VIERVRVENTAANGFVTQERTKELVIKDSVAEHTGFGYAGSGAEAFSGFVADFARDAVLVNNQARDGGAFGFNIVTNPNDLALLGNLVAGNAQGGVIVQGGSGGANVGVPAEGQGHARHPRLRERPRGAGLDRAPDRQHRATLRLTTDVVAGDNGVPASAVRVGPNSSDVALSTFDYAGTSRRSRLRSARPAPTRSRAPPRPTCSTGSAATTRSRARTAPTSWPAARAATPPVAGPATTWRSAATTPTGSSARPATTSSPAAAATTRSTAAPATTWWSAASAPTRSPVRPATTT
jgi:hypothetical protein